MLDANDRENLSWRDIQHLIVSSALQIDIDDIGWSKNGANLHINDKYGFGIINAERILNLTTTFERVPQAGMREIESGSISSEIPRQSYLEFQVEVPPDNSIESFNVYSLEHTQLYVDLQHPSRGNLRITLISPNNTSSELASFRGADVGNSNMKWTFMTVRNWGENPTGTWTIRIENRADVPGTLKRWKLTYHGVSCPRSQWIEPLNKDSSFICPWEIIDAERQRKDRETLVIGASIGLSVAVLAMCSFFAWRYRSVIKNSAWVRRWLPDDKFLLPLTDSKEIAPIPLQAVVTKSNAIETVDSARSTPTLSESFISARQESSPSALRPSSSYRKLDVLTSSNGRLNRTMADMGQLPSPMPIDVTMLGRSSGQRQQFAEQTQSLIESGNGAIDSPKSPGQKAKFQFLKGKRAGK